MVLTIRNPEKVRFRHSGKSQGLSKNEFEYTISYLSDLIRIDSENTTWLLTRMILYVTEEKYDLARADLELFKKTFSSEFYNEIKKSSYYTIIMEKTK